MNYEAFVSVLGRLSAQASLLVILVLLAQKIFKRWLSPQIRCALWLLPALRLVLPVSFSSGASVFNLFPKLDSNPATIVQRATTLVSTRPVNLPLGNESLSVNGIRSPQIQSSAKQTPLIDPLIREQSAVTPIPLNASASPSVSVKMPTAPAKGSIHLEWGILTFGLWAVVAGILLLRVWMTSRQMVRSFQKLKPLADQKTLDLFEGCKEEVRVGTMIDLVESAEITSPVLFGCLRPRLILPAGLRENLSWEELRFIFLHELAHVRRRDILFNWAGALLQIAHWFNPLIWFAFARWRADREVACDALALETAGEEKRKDYGRTILRLLAAAPGGMAAPAMVGILEDKRQLKERISMIGGYVPRKGWPFLAILFLAALAWVGLTDARRGVIAAQKTAAIEKSRTDEGTRPIFVAKRAEPLLVTNGPSVKFTVVDESGKAVTGAEIMAPHQASFFGGGGSSPTWKTDSDGHAEIRLGEVPKEPTKQVTWFTVSIRHLDFAPFGLSWNQQKGDARPNVPAEIMATLKKGIRVGGFVKDELGKPLQRIRVAVFGTGYSYQNGNQPHQEYSEFWSDLKTAPASITDADGHWETSNFPSDLEQVHIATMRPNGSVQNFVSYIPENPFNTANGEKFDLAKLKEGKEVFVLKDGVTVSGVVLGPDDKPLPGVLMTEGGRRYDPSSGTDFRTDQNGRFDLRNRRARKQLLLVAIPDNLAITSTIVEVGPDTEEIRLNVGDAKPLRGKVVDETGKPIAGAAISLDQVRSEGLPIALDLKTDARGSFVWTNAPLIPFTLAVSTPSRSLFRQVRVEPGNRNLQIQLRPGMDKEIKVRGRAVDADTGATVEIRSVSFRTDFFGKPAQAIGVGGNKFDLSLSADEFQQGWDASFKVEVVAGDYQTFTSESRPFNEGDWDLGDIKMVKGGGSIRGTVQLSDGTPAAGAEITVALQENSFLSMNNPGKVWKGDQAFRVVADNSGNFELKDTVGDRLILITHDDGFLKASTKELRAEPKLRLERWGRIEGVLKVGNKPASSGRVVLMGGKNYSPDGWTFFLSGETAGDGTFSINKVPSGEHRLFRSFDKVPGPITETYQQPVTVRPGETTRIEYGGLGRPIVGQVEGNVDWQNDLHVLVLKQPPGPVPPSFDDYVRVDDFQKANNEFQTKQQLLRRNDRSYWVKFAQDGFFRIEDVPAGTYELRIKVTEPPKSQQDRFDSSSRREIASLTREVVVPEMKDGRSDEPLDLGTLQMQWRVPQSRQPTVTLAAQTLDGKEFSLENLRGKFVLLNFWTGWSRGAGDQLDALKTLYADLQDNDRVALVSVSAGGKPEEIKEKVKTAGYQWQQTFLTGKDLAKATEEFEINSLPAAFLINPEGQIVARDLKGDRMQKVLNTALQKQ